MNSLAKKIFVVLFALMLGFGLIIPQADAVDHCIGSMCSNCNWMMPPMSGSIPGVGFDGQMCNSSFAAGPCNLNNHPDSNTKIFTVTSIKQNRKKTGSPITFAIFGTSLLQNVSKKGNGGHFQVTTDTIPIYLKNLSFLC